MQKNGKKSVLFTEGKKTKKKTALIKKIKKSHIIMYFYIFESIVVKHIKNVHNMSLLFIRIL